MPSLTRKKFAPDQLVTCVESFGAADGGCAAGTKLRGGDPRVLQRPQFFIDAASSDDEIKSAAESLYPNGLRMLSR